ncbi:MAG TPA: hydrolase 2, exosortase A system-associated, partial [Burkholderiales bacterium]|nr:hydrolase 2, exosortase A system-associated [Burkholderiales bacterium]
EPGNRLCIYHPAADGSKGCGFVYVHPFCEEMNKARRMAALQSRRLAAAGHAVLQIDLFGCGDSSGDFADARWGIWKQDLRIALAWLKSRANGPLGLWGLRLGASLAADAAGDHGLGVEQLLLWQPVSNGEQFLTQFLRLRLAAEMLVAGEAQTGVRELRETLARGGTLEIAGYDLHPGLAAEIDALNLADLMPAVERVHCLEVSPAAEPRLSPASQRALEAWRSKGLDIRAAAVRGEPFWSTTEITVCEALIAATEDCLERAY